MPYLLVFLLGPVGVLIALYRRNPKRFLDGPTEDAPLRLMRWAIGLLTPQRAEWGRAMLGELGHLDGRLRRMRFTLGCTAAALALPPWGRAAAGVLAMIAVAAASLSVYTGLAIHYRLDGFAWVEVAVVTVLCVGFLLGASALLRRPGVALPGLLGGLFATVASLAIAGFTFYDQVAFIPGQWQLWVAVIIVPALVGAVGTLWRRDPAIGRTLKPRSRHDSDDHTGPDGPTDPATTRTPSRTPHTICLAAAAAILLGASSFLSQSRTWRIEPYIRRTLSPSA